jgi:hypothetical protein
MESWVEVESKGLCWLVSSDGRIETPAHESTYTRTRNGKNQTFTGSFPRRRISPCATKSGYLEVAAMKNGKRVKHTLHRLVGMAFVPGFREDLTINHINGNKLDNRPENLEWVSLARNTQHQWETGLVDLRGEKQPGSKLTSKRVTYIRRLLAQGVSAHTLAVVAGVSDSLIALIRDGKRWPTVTAGKKVHASSPPASK